MISVKGCKRKEEIIALKILLENPRYLKINKIPRFTIIEKIKIFFLDSFSEIKIPILKLKIMETIIKKINLGSPQA